MQCQALLDGVGRQRLSVRTWEEGLAGAGDPLAKVGLERGRRGGGQGRGAVLAALAGAGNVRSCAKVDAGDLQTGDLAEPQPGLDREGEHRSVSAVGPGAGGDGIQQGLRFGAGQERHLRLRVLLDGDGGDPGDGVQALG